jgi:nanoRNase/pAp phosphatase (c-di-AMP/oligoRNAs hydrolase)
MDTNALSQIRDLIARSNRVAIVVSANPSVDQMAGALAISLSMNAQGKKTYVISPTAALVEHSSLVGIEYKYKCSTRRKIAAVLYPLKWYHSSIGAFEVI